jgi:hypothetical protein
MQKNDVDFNLPSLPETALSVFWVKTIAELSELFSPTIFYLQTKIFGRKDHPRTGRTFLSDDFLSPN